MSRAVRSPTGIRMFCDSAFGLFPSLIPMNNSAAM